MPYWHCKECHHEWEAAKEQECDWCHSGCYMLEKRTSFEKYVEDLAITRKCQWVCHGCDDVETGVVDPCRLYCGDDFDPLWCPLERDERASWRRMV
jgi:hypothetical protein